ncbi:ribosome maturation factor RimM [Mucilaginibacter sp. KACC 22063]|uniref:ribosome maturation factor RimM n=1 Tax=Mucilaginibacter sp. KACC 22063 TaxID=3025666 RepID=UPI00236537D2|nr:ribosome maturation factor RimM [Mucilaginibacter sp. KACC 22063]WDF55383.1 ribosome maturation factor RimM [Mucilaginibacter sp. KACC 22063]
MKSEDTFRIGTFTKARGLKGELQLYVDFDNLDSIKFNAVFVDIAGKLVPYFVKSIKYPMANTAYVNLEEVDTVEKATVLAKKDVFLPNKLKPKKAKEEFTLKDLKGFIAIDETLGELGEITDVMEYPQQIIASLQYQNREVLFPLNGVTIKGIDLEGGEVYLDLPEGLLDVYLD